MWKGSQIKPPVVTYPLIITTTPAPTTRASVSVSTFPLTGAPVPVPPPTTTTATTPSPASSDLICGGYTCPGLYSQYGVRDWKGADMAFGDTYAWFKMNCNNPGQPRDADTQSRLDTLATSFPGFVHGPFQVCA